MDQEQIRNDHRKSRLWKLPRLSTCLSLHPSTLCQTTRPPFPQCFNNRSGNLVRLLFLLVGPSQNYALDSSKCNNQERWTSAAGCRMHPPCTISLPVSCSFLLSSKITYFF